MFSPPWLEGAAALDVEDEDTDTEVLLLGWSFVMDAVLFEAAEEVVTTALEDPEVLSDRLNSRTTSEELTETSALVGLDDWKEECVSRAEGLAGAEVEDSARFSCFIDWAEADGMEASSV